MMLQIRKVNNMLKFAENVVFFTQNDYMEGVSTQF